MSYMGREKQKSIDGRVATRSQARQAAKLARAKKLMKDGGLTQAKAAARVGWTPEHLCRLLAEKGDKPAPKLAKAS